MGTKNFNHIKSSICVLLWSESNQNDGNINHASLVERVNKEKNSRRFIWYSCVFLLSQIRFYFDLTNKPLQSSQSGVLKSMLQQNIMENINL